MGFDKEASSSSHALKAPPPPPLPREDTPLLPNKPPQSSQSKTFANVFIAIVGAGVLGLPYTFKKTGWLMGCLMIFFVSFLTCYCMMLLVETRRKIESFEGFTKISSFGDLGFSVCGPIGRFAVDLMIVLCQAGFCISYLIFIAHTLAYVFHQGSDEKILGFLSPKAFYIWGCFPFQLGLNSIPSLTHLAPLSIFADVVDLGAMGIVMVKDVISFLKFTPVLQPFGSFSVFFYGLGVAVYSFEGIGMVLPLEAEAKSKEKFGKTMGWVMFFISLLYATFGVLGYMAFGEETKDIITTNLGRGLISYLVQFGLCINLFITFPLMMNPVYEIAERRLCNSSYSMWLRWLVVLTVSLCAILVPNFADFLSLVGSSVCVCLGFILPSLFHLLVFKEEMGTWDYVKDVAILLFGAVVAVSGTYTSLTEIFGPKSS